MRRQLFGLASVVAAVLMIVAGPALAAAPAAHKASRHVAKPAHHKPVVHRAHKAAKKTVRHAPAVRHASAVAHAPAVPHAPAAAAAKPAPPAAPTSCADGDLVPTSADLDRIRAATLCLINMQRAAAGVGQLTEQPDLDAAAASHTQDMIAHDYFDHVGPTGVGLLDRVIGAGYAALGAVLGLGENIAAASAPLDTPNATVAQWMGSPGHRANLLDPSYTDTGLGAAAALPPSLGLGADGATYTEVFGAAT
jgi:uncharacterized protein YkwD